MEESKELTPTVDSGSFNEEVPKELVVVANSDDLEEIFSNDLKIVDDPKELSCGISSVSFEEDEEDLATSERKPVIRYISFAYSEGGKTSESTTTSVQFEDQLSISDQSFCDFDDELSGSKTSAGISRNKTSSRSSILRRMSTHDDDLLSESRSKRTSKSPMRRRKSAHEDDLLSQSRSKRSYKPTMRRRKSAQDDDLMSSSYAGSCDFDDNAHARSDHFARRRRTVDEALTVSERIMATSEQGGKIQSVMDGLTINKLQHDKVRFIGREEETKLLMECYGRLNRTTGRSSLRKELVFVNGYSGVGKSSLVSSMLEVCDKGSTGFCARVKFSSVDGPYAAMASVFDQILENIERRGLLSVSTSDESGKFLTLGEALTTKLGEDIHLLATLIPKVKVIIHGSGQRRNSRRRRENNDFEADQYRWEYALRVLTRELNMHYSPLVLFLDDVHWADQLSLNLIDSLMSDVVNKSPFMVVGCYRSNALGKYHVLPKKLEQLANKPAYYGFNLSDIEIGNMDQDGIHSIIMTLLSMDDEKKTESLADICFRRTHGNPFFLIEFMTMLNNEDLIRFSLGSFTWSWDEQELERETMSTENVVNIVHSRMKKLSRRAQQVMEYAACLGSTISTRCLEILTSELEEDKDADTLSALLQQLEEGGFIENIESTRYRWVHDNIRESALMLGDAADRMFQFDVGNTLFHHLGEDELDKMLFEVCDLVNLGQHARRVEYANLNLRAAEKARSLSAFNSASLYATKGIAYLPNDKWTEHHDLTLQLYVLGMEMELATGRVEEMEKYSQEILTQPSCTAIEKLPVYLAKSRKMTHMDLDHKGCTDLLQRILRETFRIRLISTKSILQVEGNAKLFGVVRTVKRLPKRALANLQPLDDANLEAAMDLLVRLSISSYAGKNMLLYRSCITKLVQLTLKHGVHPMSGYSFVGLGMCLMNANGDAVEGASIANLAKELQEVVLDDCAVASSTTMSNSLLLPWSSTLQSCRSALKEGHISGMRSGNTESAMLSLYLHSIVFPFLMGKPLAPIESICGTIAAQCEELKLGLYAVLVRQHWELI